MATLGVIKWNLVLAQHSAKSLSLAKLLDPSVRSL
jgi:hypothetical protein